MANNYFKFKQFTVFQSNCAMKVGTDGVVLACLTEVTEAKNILDIGTGTGLLALMLAQKKASARIDAVEIDSLAYQQAKSNFKASPWEINAVCDSIQNFSQKSKITYDCIISNPPYFVQSLKNPKEQRRLARHDDALSFQDLIEAVIILLEADGVFHLILPITEAKQFKVLAKQAGLFCNKETSILPNPNKAAKRIVMEFSKRASDIDTCELLIETEERHVYSPAFKQLCDPFYL